MSPVSPTQNGFETVKTTKDRKVLARSKWLILASAISRKRCPSQSVKNEESLLRFPSFEVIEAKQDLPIVEGLERVVKHPYDLSSHDDVLSASGNF